MEYLIAFKVLFAIGVVLIMITDLAQKREKK